MKKPRLMADLSPAYSAAIRRAVSVVVALSALAVVLGLLGRGTHTGRISMKIGEAIVLFATLFLSTAAAAAAALSASRLIAGWLRPSRVLSRENKRVAWLYLGLGCMEVGCGLWARFVEPTWLTTTRRMLALPGLQSPIRMVVFSDMHSDGRFDLDMRVARAINELHPDLIFFLGDSLNDESRAPAFRQALASMRARIAKLAIRGNWDAWFWSDIDLFGGTGFDEIVDGYLTIAVDKNLLRVGGHEWLDDWAPQEILKSPPPGSGPAIFLYHANDYLPLAAAAGVDLYLCGDTHGGQVQLPGWGPVFAVGRQGLAFVRGLYEIARTGEAAMKAYVTPGIGVEPSIPYRLGVRPEITVLDLVPMRSD
jgi:uncharacterized protein